MKEKELGRVFLVQADILCFFPAGGWEILVGGSGAGPCTHLLTCSLVEK